MRKLVLATRNNGKIVEFERMMKIYANDIEVLGATQFPDLPDVVESGTSFTENALLKAREISAFTNLPALADDSGLSIDALNGDPGIFSARWAGVHGNDAANIAKVLAQLREINGPDVISKFSARFKCAVALVFPAQHPHFGLELVEEGNLEGSIAQLPRGNSGFGYDPIFIPNGYQLTLGEFTHGEKDRISHRAQALTKIAPQITSLL